MPWLSREWPVPQGRAHRRGRDRRVQAVISDVDIVLYDTFGQVQGMGIDLEDFVRNSGGAKVVIYSWNLNRDLIDDALVGGASGYLSKVLTGPAIVEALERIMSGETVILVGDNETSVGGAGDWPGRDAGLSPREAEVIALITQGLSNKRSQIVRPRHQYREDLHPFGLPQDRRRAAHPSSAWAVDNGFKPDTLRTIDPALLVRPAASGT